MKITTFLLLFTVLLLTSSSFLLANYINEEELDNNNDEDINEIHKPPSVNHHPINDLINDVEKIIKPKVQQDDYFYMEKIYGKKYFKKNILNDNDLNNNKNKIEFSHPFIVKFTKKLLLTNQFKKLFETTLNCKLLQYLPQHSYFVMLNNLQLNLLKKHFKKLINKIIPYLPKMKINPTLQNNLKQNNFCKDNVHLSIRLFPNLTNINKISNEITKMLSKKFKNLINLRLKKISNDKLLFSLNNFKFCNSTSLKTLQKIIKYTSYHRHIYFIEELNIQRQQVYPEVTVLNNNEPHKSSTKWIMESSIPNQLPFTNVGLTGRNQTVAISDSGLDYNHCFFYDEKVPVNFIHSERDLLKYISLNQNNNEHRKIKAYVSFMDKLDGGHGHGSHTTGILGGKCPKDNSQLCNYNGIAKDSKIVFFDVGCNLPGGCECESTFNTCPCYLFNGNKCPGNNNLMTPIDLYNGLLLPQYLLGAKISSNSLGGRIGEGYTQMTEEIDRFQYDYDDFLVIWSAGNSGLKGYMTLTGPTKQAKNSIIVGCSLNDVEEWKEIMTKYRDWNERAKVLKKQLEKKFNCKCGTCNEEKCESFKKLINEDGCNEFFGPNCEMKYHLPIMNKKLNFNVTYACSSKCALKYLNDEKLKVLFNYQNLADFSSLGPSLDGRIKPDIVAPGYYTLSTRSHFGKDKCSTENVDNLSHQLKEMGGTSMSTPAVAGTAAIVRQYFEDGFYPNGEPSDDSKYRNPSASLVKAIILSSARGMNGLAQRFNFFEHFNAKHRTIFEGFGLINLSNALKLKEKPEMTNDLFVVDRKEISTTDIHLYQLEVTEYSRDLAITLVWTDYPASPLASLALVNDLDLILEYKENGKSKRIYGNHLYTNNRAPDHMNNVEKILINNPPIKTKLNIIVRGYSIPHGPQKYSLVVNAKQLSKVVKEKEVIQNPTKEIVAFSDDQSELLATIPELRDDVVTLYNWEFSLIIVSIGLALLVSLAVNIVLGVKSYLKNKQQYVNLESEQQ
ncbi:hypothetical protein ABK040_008150 [Willaertia magna]